MDCLMASQQFQWLPETAPAKSDMTFSSSEPVSVIDWMLAPSNWIFQSYHVIDSHLSDHRPIVARLKMQPVN